MKQLLSLCPCSYAFFFLRWTESSLGAQPSECTRLEAHLALVEFRPHSILKGGIKTQTQLYLTVAKGSQPQTLTLKTLSFFLFLFFLSPEMLEVSAVVWRKL